MAVTGLVLRAMTRRHAHDPGKDEANPQAISETWGLSVGFSADRAEHSRLLAYQFALLVVPALRHRARPGLIAIFLITLWATNIPQALLRRRAVVFLLGGLGGAHHPLFASGSVSGALALSLMVALLAGSATAAVSAMFIAKALGATSAAGALAPDR